MKKNSLEDALNNMADDIEDVFDEFGEVFVEAVVDKSFEDTGELKRSVFWGEGGVYFEQSDTNTIEKIFANEYGTVHMTGSAAVRRSIKEFRKLIKEARRRAG